MPTSRIVLERSYPDQNDESTRMRSLQRYPPQVGQHVAARSGYGWTARLERARTASIASPSMRLVIARCSVDYAGRLSTHLPSAVRLLMVKADGSVLVHADGGGYKPLNWMSAPCTLHEEPGCWRVSNRGGETMTIAIQEDLLRRDEGGSYVAVEIKRRGEIDGVEQLTRYLERLRLGLEGIRGVFAAMSFAPQAKVLAAARGIECLQLDYDALRGLEPSTPRLF